MHDASSVRECTGIGSDIPPWRVESFLGSYPSLGQVADHQSCHLADRTTEGSCLTRRNEMPSLRRFNAGGSGLRIDEVGSLINLLVWFRESLIACLGG